MHPSVLAQRKAIAANRIVERATALVQHLELDPALAQSLQPTGVKDTQTVDMLRLEGLATLLDQLAENAGVPAPAVTDVTVGEFTAPAPEPVVPINEPLTKPSLDGPLPPAILDEDEPKPSRKSKSSKKK